MADILLSALRAHQALLEGASGNISNMNTKGYTPVRTTLSEGPGGAVQAHTEREPAQPHTVPEGCETSNVDLPREICDLIRARRGFESVLAAIREREEMFDELMSKLANERE